jgi:hypothetical protein
MGFQDTDSSEFVTAICRNPSLAPTLAPTLEPTWEVPTQFPTSIPSAPPTVNPNFNPFPSSRGEKVLWGYYFMGQPFVPAFTIITKKINYLVVSFGDISPTSSFVFPGGGCGGVGTKAKCNTFLTDAIASGWFKMLHDAGISISISLGGAGAHLPSATVDPEKAIRSFQSKLESLGIEQVLALSSCLSHCSSSPAGLTQLPLSIVLLLIALLLIVLTNPTTCARVFAVH